MSESFGQRLRWMRSFGHALDWLAGESRQATIRTEDEERYERLGDQAQANINLQARTRNVEQRALALSRKTPPDPVERPRRWPLRG